MNESEDKSPIACVICGAKVHAIRLHLKDAHPGITIEDYSRDYPNAPLFSPMAERLLKKREEEMAVESRMASAATATVTPINAMKPQYFHEVFGLGEVKEAKSGRGDPIPCTMVDPGEFHDMVPDVDGNYVFDIELLKNTMMAIELNIPFYLWGHAGTGKTTLPEQIAARTKRPMLRVQHTIGLEERDVLGQWTVRGGQTVFQLGPLALAMKHGWLYLADEYDFALPAVLSVYQPVLEGKSLVIKEADHENRVIKPHRNFRFGATGNTNGSGDDTGLYQGTSIQNAANYDRMGMVMQVVYMKPALEIQMVVKQAEISEADAAKLVDFANRVREAYDGGKVSNTISPRALIGAAKLGIRKGSWRTGVTLAFINKLSKVDREVVDGLAQRVFA